ncbi:proline hydroxylase [Kitasatospora sp. NPDC058162]|uniref:proline hydroxylase n=1 Tax=Kitasatospora sp. NPDC058162 TaxID=3346362 RepID=UPI0036DC2D04
MPSQRLLDPLFVATEASAFTERHLADLVAGTTAAVRVPGFLAGATRRAIRQALTRLPIAAYDPARVADPIIRFGPALNDYRTLDGGLDHERYWPAADAARAAWSRAGLRPDPVAAALKLLGCAWGEAVQPATVNGRPLFGGTVREINSGALIHYDEAVREVPGLFDQPLVAQLAFNTWVLAPEAGGETKLWRRRWQPEDEQHRHSYGYQSPVTDGAQLLELTPAAGEGLLFAPANYHAIAPAVGRRVALAFFLGLTTRGNLIAWS